MRARMRLSVLAGIVCSALAVAGVAWAAGAKTTVTLKGPDHVYGKVKSSAKSCVKGRKVFIFKQHGATQSPKTDQKVYGPTTSDSQGRWDAGNPGLGHGKFYAEATKKPGCKAGFSPTVHF